MGGCDVTGMSVNMDMDMDMDMELNASQAEGVAVTVQRRRSTTQTHDRVIFELEQGYTRVYKGIQGYTVRTLRSTVP